MNRKNQIFEAVSKHILKEFYELNEQQARPIPQPATAPPPTPPKPSKPMLPSLPQVVGGIAKLPGLLGQGLNTAASAAVNAVKSGVGIAKQEFDIQQRVEAEIAAREAQRANPNAPGGVGPVEPTADEKVKAMLDKFRGDRDAAQKAQQDVIDGKTKIRNFPGSVLRVGENMSQMSMRQGEASKALAGLPPPMMRSGRGGNSGLPNAATYGVPGAEVVYNPNRINSPTALMALRNNAAKAAARLKAQEAGAASAPAPASNTGAGSSTAPPASGQAPSTTTPPGNQNQQLPPESSVRMPRNVA